MASGKSTIARHLAAELGWSFFDIDEEIERAEKTSIASIFDSRGEAEFRRIEAGTIAQHVRWIERGHPAVVALGGGAFAEARNRDLLLDHGLAVWLDCPLEKVKQRVAQASHRPLARDPEKLRSALPRAPPMLCPGRRPSPSKATTRPLPYKPSCHTLF
jgi:shikimate kinase